MQRIPSVRDIDPTWVANQSSTGKAGSIKRVASKTEIIHSNAIKRHSSSEELKLLDDQDEATLKVRERILESIDQVLIRWSDTNNILPIHDVLSVHRLELYAICLSDYLTVAPKVERGRPLLPTLKQNGAKLSELYGVLSAAILNKEAITPAAESFVDNWHIVLDQLTIVEQDLPINYYYELPKLSLGLLKGYPRVYAISLIMVAYTDSAIDPDMLARFIEAFQQKCPLTIGELWAVAITLRIVLFEQLRLLAVRVNHTRNKKQRANAIADSLLAMVSLPTITPIDLVHKLSRSLAREGELDRTLIVQISQRLRDQDPIVRPAMVYLEQQITERYHTSTNTLIQTDHHSEAADQVTILNIISSMRVLNQIDWIEFVEGASLTHHILENDPAAVYSNMNFATRDQYRHVVERIAKRSSAGETDIAQFVVERANEFKQDQRRGHIGYWLVSDGVKVTEASMNYVPTLTEKIKSLVLQYPTPFYLGSLALLTVVTMLPSLYYASHHSTASDFFHWWCWLIVGLTLFPSSELALCLLNHTITLLVTPKSIPSMDTELGIPADAKSMVVIPMMLTSEKGIQEIVNHLEVHYIANEDPNLSFALLSDYTDADKQDMPDDVRLYTFAQAVIAELNTKYKQSTDTDDKFYLFHRVRQWNPHEGKNGRFMGWERKRGKIHEFNLLLRGDTNTSYINVKARAEFLASVKYVITLDQDTKLPRETAARLIGVICHPLNAPVFDEQKMLVTEGYGILQPRVTVDLQSSLESRFSQLFSNYIGIDAYHTTVSDVYQDLFDAASFVGKGLYVVDMFIKATEGRIPENTILSHDLFESLFVRAALVTEVELYDDHPSDWATFARRQHRWIRGDWQLLPYLLPTVPNEKWQYVKNPFCIISLWKMFDNLRRSFVSPMLLAWMLAAWIILPGSPRVWTGLVMITGFSFPVYALFTSMLMQLRGKTTWRLYLHNSFQELMIKIGQFVLGVSFLIEQSMDYIDAIGRTLYRRYVTHRMLLEWTTSAQVESLVKQGKGGSKLMQAGPIAAITLMTVIAGVRPLALPVAAPFLAAWLLSPWLKIYMRGSPVTSKLRQIPTDGITQFRAYARRTWHFFETFVSADDHWLAPDNFQEDPAPVVAHRTSPTNIGLQLLATISAQDLGYIGALECLELLENTFETLLALERYNGHFYNWYATDSAQPLYPKYISTVDSGNLAGHLIVLKQWCAEPMSLVEVNNRAQQGIVDTLIQLASEIKRVNIVSTTSGGVTTQQLHDAIVTTIELVRKSRWPTMTEWNNFLNTLHYYLEDAHDLLNALTIDDKSSTTFKEVRIWMNLALKQVTEFQRDNKLLSLPTIEYVSRRAMLSKKCDQLFYAMDFRFLFDSERKLFTIGFNVGDNRLDHYHYDLLASESRLASFIAIAKGDVPQEHWFRLGRQLTPVAGGQALISWTASMFEYLMPLLCMKSYDDTLLAQTYDGVVKRQIEYGQIQGTVWGISEAGYNARDLALSYQYGPFGVPGLGLKRGLSEDLVISPYSTMLASMVEPMAALQNLRSLEALNAFSKYGFHESLDFTVKRLPAKQKYALLHSYMAHHQGMSLLALNNVLNDDIMQQRFHNDPLVKSSELLLQERIPSNSALSVPRADEVKLEGTTFFFAAHPNPRVYTDPSLPTPRTQLLSNGYYSIMVTSAGSGYSRCNGMAINRWREDSTRDCWGNWIYIKDLDSNHLWSTGYQPVNVEPEEYEVTFSEDKVEIVRVDQEILTHTEIIVATNDNVELRRVSLTNHSDRSRTIEITSFMEIVLAPPQDDDAHTTFSNLFVQTEYDPASNSLLATRRRRSHKQNETWLFQTLVIEGEEVGSLQYETDRARFIGRGKTASAPFVLTSFNPSLSNTVGSVLDPCFSLRQAVRIPPGATVRATFATGLTSHRDEAVGLAEKYQDAHVFIRETQMVWIQSQVQLRHLNIDTDKAHWYQRLAGRVLYSDSSLRPHSRLLSSNTRVQANLWPYGISGDLPIILTGISDAKDVAMVRDLLHAHEYLRLKGLSIDLVILNEHPPSYIQALQEELQRQVNASAGASLIDKRGGIHIRRSDIMPIEDITLIKSIARIYLRADQGTLEEQVKRRPVDIALPPPLLVPAKARRESKVLEPILPLAELSRQLSRQSSASSEFSCFNGLGGFTHDAREYVITLSDDSWTPAPWINVIANDNDFGCIVSESGCGYTFSVNSRENRITPWCNDPISDTPGECLYIRDETTGEFWSPTPLPIREPEKYIVRHGQGYTTFLHNSHGIAQSLRIFVPTDKHETSGSGVKITELTLSNTTSQARQLSITHYNEWVLGIQRHQAGPTVVTEIDKESKAVFATNGYNNEFNTRLAFVQLVSDQDRSVTCDRTEFLGRNGSTANPAAMTRTKLSGTAGAGFDPCAAIRSGFTLAPGETRRFIVLLGEAENGKDARTLINKYKELSQVDAAFHAAVQHWDSILNTIEVKTPDMSFNILVNRWLLYQTLSCRIWARSAFYQSGGAFGFRDQLQDVMAMVYARPKIAREQIIRAAGRQFPEGDVQHWWHPPTGRGVRTHCSDDALFLPYVLSFYIRVTGDTSIVNETAPFLKAPLLQPNQEDSYSLPGVDHDNQLSILEHAIRVCDRHLEGGAHGLPFIGSCDWNDGMNMVGHEGKGESVWLAWFLYATLEHFSVLCDKYGQGEKSKAYRERMVSLKAAIESQAWDGDWYRRAFFDDGSPLGSKQNDECQIDSLAQSWAILSGAGDKARAQKAMASADTQLVHRDSQLIQLFTPAFDKGKQNPGYIKGYVPGVRENGGQYTHAAVWLLMAFAEMGDGDRAVELYHLLNPINHSNNRAGVQRYKVEPYVIAADVYGRAPHIGRGGWTWYTGSSSWMYRAAIESILGLRICSDELSLQPHIPRSWPAFELTYRTKQSSYRIMVQNRPSAPTQSEMGDEDVNSEPVYELDGQILREQKIKIVDDGHQHTLRIQL